MQEAPCRPEGVETNADDRVSTDVAPEGLNSRFFDSAPENPVSRKVLLPEVREVSNMN